MKEEAIPCDALQRLNGCWSNLGWGAKVFSS